MSLDGVLVRVQNRDCSALCQGKPWSYCCFPAGNCCHLRRDRVDCKAPEGFGPYECQKYGMWL